MGALLTESKGVKLNKSCSWCSMVGTNQSHKEPASGGGWGDKSAKGRFAIKG